MPSGSKKRKSSKKPKPLGDPPELEAGLDDGAMRNDEDEIGEAIPSPKGIDGDPEAMAERGLEGNKVNGEVPQEGDAQPVPPKEDFQTHEAIPDQDVGGQCNPPSQAEPEPEIPNVIEPEAPAVFELEGETAQRETEPQTDTPLVELEAKTDATPEEIKPELESDAVPVESQAVADATPDASPDEIKPDADIGLNEIESSKESTKPEREFELDAARIGDESFVETEKKTDAASADIEPEIDKAPDEFKLEKDAAPAEVELEICEQVKPEADAVPYIELETNDEVSVEAELETDGSPATIQPEAEVEELETVAPASIEPETEEAPRERELVADTAPKDVEAEAEEAQVEELETAAPAIIEPETEESLMEREVVTDASSMDVEAEVEEALVERDLAIDAATADDEPETDGAPVDTEAERDTAQVETDAFHDEVPPDIDAARPESQTETDVAVCESEADAAVVELEPPTEVSPAEIEPERDTAQVETDAFHDEVPPEIDAVSPENLTETDVAVCESEADTAVVELEPPTEEVSPAEIESERDTAQVETDAFHDEVPPEINAVSPENQTETDVAVCESEADTAIVELEPPTEVSPAEIELQMNAPPDEAAPEPEPEREALVEGEPEVNAEDVDSSAGVEAEMELPQETEPEPVNLAEDKSLEPLQEIEPESASEAIGEAKPEDEASFGTKAEERGTVETESDQQDFVEGEVQAAPQIDPEPEVETTHEIELEAEAEVPLEAEPEPVVEAPAEVEPDEKGLIETESDQQDVVEIEQDQSGEDQQLQKQEGETEIGELDSSVCQDNLPSESQPQLAISSDVPVIEDEPPAISGSDEANSMDDPTSSTSSSEASDNTDKERSVIEQEPEKGDNIPSSTTLEGEGESTADENQDSGGDAEQTRATAVDNEQGADEELRAELKDISEEQERAVDVGHDEDGTVVASSGNGSETEKSSEQELAIDLPPADVEESAKEDIIEEERAVDVGHGEDGAVLASAGNRGEAEVASEQELGIELPPADVVDAEELAKEGPPPSDQELITKQTQPLIDEQNLSMGLGAAVDEPPLVESEQSLNATLSSCESGMTSDAPEPQDEAVTPANDENVASEYLFNLESATGELERDIGEEEAASSTVAEVGSVLNDFDDRASYVQEELPTDFPSTDQDVDIPDCKEFDDILSTEAPESVETELRDQLDSEPPPAEKVDANTVCGLAATSEQQEVLLESAEAAKPAEDLHSVPVEEMPSEEQVLSSPQPEQVVQDSGKDEVHSSKEVVLANEEPRTAEEERAACKDDKDAANSILGTSFPNIAGDELISKAFTYFKNGQESLSSSEARSNELVQHRDESSIHQSEANNMDKAEIHAMDLKETQHNPMGGDSNNDTDEALVESASPIPEGRDMKGVQTFRQESTQEASLPVVIPAQDRAMELVNLKSTERPNGGGTLKRRTKLLDCCGMFDLLLRKN